MATVRNLACIAFRPEALDVHGIAELYLESRICKVTARHTYYITSDYKVINTKVGMSNFSRIRVLSSSQNSLFNGVAPNLYEVQVFLKGHKNLRKSPTCFDPE